jgi:aryl-alcohol dehydrogenase-like predicted oxidoreductase
VEYRELGKTGISVSVIAFGAWQIGGEPFWKSEGEKASREAIDAALEAGINLFDTAPVYGFGRSETIVGQALKSVRDRVIIATKCGLRWKGEDLKTLYNDLKPASVREEVEASLRRLNTDVIDIYQVHWPSKDDPIEATMEELAKLKDEGKIRAIGVSNFSTSLLKQSLKVAQVDSIQPKYNLLEREADEDMLPFCLEKKIGVLAYSPLASGLLTGKYKSAGNFNDWRDRAKFGIFQKETIGEGMKKVNLLKNKADADGVKLAQVAIEWVLGNRAVTSALVGVKNSSQLVENIVMAENPLGSEVIASFIELIDNWSGE